MALKGKLVLSFNPVVNMLIFMFSMQDPQTAHPKKGGLPKGTKALMKTW
jgi:preprotein translocase subunit YajC